MGWTGVFRKRKRRDRPEEVEYRFQVHFKAIELPRRHTCPGRLGFWEPEPSNDLIEVGCKSFHRPESQTVHTKSHIQTFWQAVKLDEALHPCLDFLVQMQAGRPGMVMDKFNHGFQSYIPTSKGTLPSATIDPSFGSEVKDVKPRRSMKFVWRLLEQGLEAGTVHMSS